MERRIKISVRQSGGLTGIFLDIISFVLTPPKVSLIDKNQIPKPSRMIVRLKQGDIFSIFFNLFIND